VTSCSRILNTIGLVLVVVGCFLLYFFGLPAPVDATGAVHLILEQADEAEIAKGKRYRRRGQYGIALIALGSLIQIWATWVG
jgi:hypothetical protein